MPDLSQSRDWLALLAYGLELLANPSPAKLIGSFEAWNYRNCLRPQFRRLQRLRLLERCGPGRDASWRLTTEGRLAAHGGLDPIRRWDRTWDGRWRTLLFDLPSRQKQLRLRVWRWLRTRRFGCLQRSVWISPDPLEQTALPVQHASLRPGTFIILESQTVPPASASDLVRSAWDFATLNREYQRVIEVTRRGLTLAESSGVGPLQRRQWLAEDRETWLAAVTRDPLLPSALLPPEYLGRQAWERRQAAFAALAAHC